MSRIGKLPIPVPAGVQVEVTANHVKVTGPKGTLERALPAQISVKVDGATVVCERPSDGREHRSMHGLTRTLVANMVTGVSTGFVKNLELVGVGYRVAKQGDDLVLNPRLLAPGKVLSSPGDHDRRRRSDQVLGQRRQRRAGRPGRRQSPPVPQARAL